MPLRKQMKREPKRPLVPRVEKAKSSQSFDRLRVVPLSLSPSCVTQKMAARDPEGEKHACFSPPDFHAAIFFHVTHDELSERGTTRSLIARRFIVVMRSSDSS